MTTATSTTVANPSGTYTTTYTGQPRRVRQHGAWVGVDASLRRASKGFVTQATTDATVVSAGGSAPAVTLSAAGASVGMGWKSSLPQPVVSGASADFALSSTQSLVASAANLSDSADIVLTAPPATAPIYRFPLTLSGVSIAADGTGGGYSLRNPSGATVFWIPAPMMWDAQVNAGGDPARELPVTARLIRTGKGPELDLTPDMHFLTAPSTKYPVLIDPTVSDVSGNQDTFVTGVSGGVGNTTSNGDGYRLYVGSTDGKTVSRTYIDFLVDRYNADAITNASLQLYQYEAGSCVPQATQFRALNSAFYSTGSNATVWGNRPGADSSADWLTSASFNTGAEACTPAQANGTDTINLSKLMDGFTSGYVNHYGIELQAPSSDETNTVYSKFFCSSNLTSTASHCTPGSGEDPQLSVTYTPQLGIQSSYSLSTHRLNDHSNLYVNRYDGDAVIVGNDLRLHGVGMDLTIDRYYNSESTTSGVFGPGWTMSVGPDVLLRRRGGSGNPGSWFDYQAPSGTTYSTYVEQGTSNSYYKPTHGNLDASLSYVTTGQFSGDYKLNFDGSRVNYYFAGCATCDQHLVAEADGQSTPNKITYAYNSSNQLTSVTDTEGRTVTLAYNSDGTLHTMSDATGRIWTYGYSGGLLTSYTDPANNTVTYTYNAGLLTKVTDPAGSDGSSDHPTTDIGYSGSSVTSVSYERDSGTNASYEFTYSYGMKDSSATPLSARCSSGDDDDLSTDVVDVNDANGGTTTYCYRYAYVDKASPAQFHGGTEQVYDGDGKKRSSSFSADSQAQSTTDAMTASTAFTFSSSLQHDLTEIDEPRDSGDTGGSTMLNYDDTAHDPDLPTSVANPDSTCTNYAYASDGSGNMTDSYLGASPTSNDCSNTTTGVHNHRDYNSNGTVKDSYNPDGSSTVETSYTYYNSSNDAGNSYLDGQLFYSVAPGGAAPASPSPGAACSSSTPLCTSYTYDTADRVTSVADGDGNLTHLHYDLLDRLTEIDLAGTTRCNTGHTNCYTYAYDAEGNLTSAIDTGNRRRTFTYDRLNRQTSETLPGSSTAITDTYDGAGNLTSYTDAADTTVTYAYDAANNLTHITDAAGTFGITNDDNGRQTAITEPNNITLHRSYHADGDVAEVWASGSSSLPASRTYTFTTAGSESHQLQKQQIGSGTTYYYGYNSQGWICWVGTSSFTGDCNATSGRSDSYVYDLDGDIRTANTGSGTTYYGYEDNGQLCYSGNTAGTDVAATCPATPAGDITYVNDNDGQLTGTTTHGGLITYNSDRQATSLAPLSGTGPSVSTSYQDHGNDLRSGLGLDTFDNGLLGVTAVRAGSGTTYYTRDPRGNLIDERGPAGTFYYYTDRNQSVLALFDSAGADAGDYSYDPYGNLANSLTATAAANPFRYISGYQDIEGDGYYHLGARYYDTSTARFTQPDTVIGNLANPTTVNLYAYAGGDPIDKIDPRGHDFWSGLGSAFSVAGAAGAFEGFEGALGAASEVSGIAAGIAVGAGIVSFGVLSVGALGLGFWLAGQ